MPIVFRDHDPRHSRPLYRARAMPGDMADIELSYVIRSYRSNVIFSAARVVSNVPTRNLPSGNNISAEWIANDWRGRSAPVEVPSHARPYREVRMPLFFRDVAQPTSKGRDRLPVREYKRRYIPRRHDGGHSFRRRSGRRGGRACLPKHTRKKVNSSLLHFANSISYKTR